MRILSVRPPYAQAIVMGAKDVENRMWTTDYTGELFIHSSLRIDHEFFKGRGFKGSPRDVRDKLLHSYQEGQLVGGFIIGYVHLTGVVENKRSRWATEGHYHWLLENAVAFLDPVPCKGRLGLWAPDAKLEKKLEHRIYFNEPATPLIGMGATIRVGSDRYAGTIISVTKTGKTFTMQHDIAKRTDRNGQGGMQAYAYTANPDGEKKTCFKAKDGRWRIQGERHSAVLLGKRDHFKDPEF